MARQYGFPLAPVRWVHESLDEPQLRERAFFEAIQIPEVGTLYLPRLPFRFSNKKFQSIRPAPLLGEHTETVLMEELGLRQEDMRELKKQGVI
jgi:crotonobetainyl-CoA:carnitine CoA-transferase CaiB-like acyl-CoA transferase